MGCLGGLLFFSSCNAPAGEPDYCAYVNPFIGTGGHGHTFPGAVVPHGMIQPSPDTRIDGWTLVQAIIIPTPPSTGSRIPTSAGRVAATTAMCC